MRKFYGKDYFDSELSIFLDKHARSIDCTPHTHDFIEMVYIYDGKGTHSIDGESYEAEKGSLLVINSGQVHSFACRGEMMLINILISPRFVSDELDYSSSFADVIERLGFDKDLARPFYQLSTGDIISAERICNSMREEAKKRSFAYKNILFSYLRVLISLMLRGAASKDTKKRLPSEIIEYIDAHLFESVTIDEIARNNYYNPAYLSRIFKECYGMSIKDYINEKRINKAVSLLLETSMSVAEIAAQVGYTNKNQFYKNFEYITGKSPAEVRKNIK